MQTAEVFQMVPGKYCMYYVRITVCMCSGHYCSNAVLWVFRGKESGRKLTVWALCFT